MKSKNEIQKTKQDSGGWNLEEVPSLSSSKRNYRPSKDKKIEGVEFKTILHSSLLSLLQASKKLRRVDFEEGGFGILLFSSFLQAFKGQEIEGGGI